MSCLSYIGVGDMEGIGLRRLWSVVEDGNTGDTQICKLFLFDSLLRVFSKWLLLSRLVLLSSEGCVAIVSPVTN